MMNKEKLLKEIDEGMQELGIELRVLPVKNIDTDLVPINEQGKENAEAIAKWEHLKEKINKVI